MPTDLPALIAELVNAGYAQGPRGPDAVVTLDQAADAMELLEALVDQGTRARAAEAARKQLTIACDVGCNACCEEPVMVWLGEAASIARWLRLPENAEVLARFRAAYPAWAERVGESRRRLGELVAAGEREQHRRAYIDAWRLRVVCAFNDERGACTIYPVRPILCRNNHALDTRELCAIGTAGSPRRMGFEPLEELLEKALVAKLALHHAAGGPARRPAALCEAVWELVKEA